MTDTAGENAKGCSWYKTL